MFSLRLVILAKQIATAFFTAYLVIIWNSGSYLSHILVEMCRIYDKTFFYFFVHESFQFDFIRFFFPEKQATRKQKVKESLTFFKVT